ncbi:MAG: UvrD-helicase domain-containing protein [Negativicutes bacterium]|nr:UvrD-helicase domain-containing protein [Negativicutes bacterium]
MELAHLLNPEQEKAVRQTEGPLLIIAGAGSGKTRVLTYRVAWLLEQGVDPARILAITFTNKATQEMKERILAMVGEQGSRIWISTFHAMCVRILRQDIENLGYQRNFTILDQDDSLKVIKRLLKERNLDEEKYKPAIVADAIDKVKNKMGSGAELARTAKDLFERNLAGILQAYEQYTMLHNTLDFNDLLNLTVRLFQTCPEVLERYRNRFQYIMVDEYQDTNFTQYRLINLLAGEKGNLCVVGDEDQGIYSWRGADISNILNFERDYPGATVIKLEQNYRSTQNILDAAHDVIRNNTQRKEKKLWTEKRSKEKVTLLETENETDEARTVISMIDRLKREKGYQNQDFAILYRTHAQSRKFEDVCNENALPYILIGGLKFFSRKEVKDIIAYLHVLVNPYDDVALRRIINVPRRGIGETSFSHIDAFAREMGIPYYAALEEADAIPELQARVAKKLREFVQQLDNYRKMSAYLSVSEMVKTVIESSGYLQELQASPDPDSEDKVQNLMEFVNVAVEYEKKPDMDLSLEGFLTNASLNSENEAEGSNPADRQLTLMSLHAAKGLEFPVVFLTGLEEGIFPFARAIYDDNAMEEERRLCYVGMTRAKDLLFLSYARQRQTYGATNYNRRSRFIDEISEDLLQEPKATRSRKAAAEKEPLIPIAWSKVTEWKQEKAAEQEKQPAADSGKKIAQPAGQSSTKPTKTIVNFAAGETVKHKIWGNGQVLESNGTGDSQEILVEFPNVGLKRLIVKYAALERVES